jgi:hypothetical protein
MPIQEEDTILRRGIPAARSFNPSGAGRGVRAMLGTASRLALPGLFLSFALTPQALAQERGSIGQNVQACYRTIAQASGELESSPRPDTSCSAPREMNVYGGRLGRAIMLLGDPRRMPTEQPRPAAAWRELPPPFAVPPVYR